MIKILGAGETPPSVRTKKSRAAAGTFATKAAETTNTGSANAAGAAASPSMLSALIALQTRDGSREKTYAAAQRTLDLLEEIRLSILDGETSADALEQLAKAAETRAHAGAPAELLSIYDDIALRARVELAKRGR